jgi:hypothetical protein
MRYTGDTVRRFAVPVRTASGTTIRLAIASGIASGQMQDKNAVEKGERFVSLEREQFRCWGATVWIGIAFAPQSAPKVFIGMMANRTLTFDRITTFDPYYFPPGLRFLYIAVVSCVLLIALWFKFVMLGIGGYLLNSVETEPRVGLVIGLLCGVSEALVVELLLSSSIYLLMSALGRSSSVRLIMRRKPP